MLATDERAALLRAICEHPAEDTPRLVYADWLDEHAEETACGACDFGWLPKTGTPDAGMVSRCPACRGTGRVSNGYAARAAHIRWAIANPRNSAVCLCGCRWREPNPCEMCRMMGAEVASIPRCPDGGTHYVLNRGFVREVRLTGDSWLAHADGLVWSPTMPCPACASRSDRENEGMRRYGGFLCTQCWTHHPPGTVPRPFVPTAQPIETVTLTTEPSPTDEMTWMVFDNEDGREELKWAGKRWDWIKFVPGW